MLLPYCWGCPFPNCPAYLFALCLLIFLLFHSPLPLPRPCPVPPQPLLLLMPSVPLVAVGPSPLFAFPRKKKVYDQVSWTSHHGGPASVVKGLGLGGGFSKGQNLQWTASTFPCGPSRRAAGGSTESRAPPAGEGLCSSQPGKAQPS